MAAPLTGEQLLSPAVPRLLEAQTAESMLDFADVQGHLVAKRALEIATAGFHNVIDGWTTRFW